MSTANVKSNTFRFMFLRIWGALPGVAQRGVPKVHGTIFNKKWSQHIIKPYCKAQYSDPNYLDQFLPGSGKTGYDNFQDFFTRTHKKNPVKKTDTAWACEGLLCEYGNVSEVPLVKVKGGNQILDDHYYSNVFLHKNNNYHRIHSPLNGTVKRIEHIVGKLILLRQWASPAPCLNTNFGDQIFKGEML